MNAPEILLKGMSLDDFIEQYHDAPFELIDGEIQPMSLILAGHGRRNRNLFKALDAYVVKHDLGEVYYETPYVLIYSED
jgi:Uma2 family endonuclease